jgi:hypothetical protein
MRIEIHRTSGSMGSVVPLDILLDGAKAAEIKTEETVVLMIPSGAHQRQVVQDFLCSPVATIPNNDEPTRFECGTETWVAWDFLNLCYLPSFRDSVFFPRKSERFQINSKLLIFHGDFRSIQLSISPNLPSLTSSAHRLRPQ